MWKFRLRRVGDSWARGLQKACWLVTCSTVSQQKGHIHNASVRKGLLSNASAGPHISTSSQACMAHAHRFWVRGCDWLWGGRLTERAYDHDLAVAVLMTRLSSPQESLTFSSRTNRVLLWKFDHVYFKRGLLEKNKSLSSFEIVGQMFTMCCTKHLVELTLHDTLLFFLGHHQSTGLGLRELQFVDVNAMHSQPAHLECFAFSSNVESFAKFCRTCLCPWQGPT